MASSYDEYEVDVLKLTDKAALLRFEDDEERWVPLSVIEDSEDWTQDMWAQGYSDVPWVELIDVSVNIATWFARKEGFQ